MKHINNSNYDNDDREYLSDFLEYLSEKKKDKEVVDSNNNLANIDKIPSFDKNSAQKLTTLELNSLYNITGYIINSIMKICKICNNCIKSVRSETSIGYSFSKFVRFKSYSKKSLFAVNIKTFNRFIIFEKMFRHYSKYFNIENINWQVFLISKFSEISAPYIKNCHHLYSKIIKRFVTFRLRIIQRKYVDSKRYDSKSMAAHTFLK